MRYLRRVAIPALLCLVVLVGLTVATGLGAPTREEAARLMGNGNWKEAYDGYSQLALSPTAQASTSGSDLEQAVQCLRSLGRENEADDLRERAIAAHPGNWRVLYAAARSYYHAEHYGYMIAGKFERGGQRGGGRWTNAVERDRVRALQLMQDAMGKIGADATGSERGDFYNSFCYILLGTRGWSESWRLQYLTDLTVLPDYGDGNTGEPNRGAPVNPDGTPVLHPVPPSWADAQNDGQRLRWAMQQAIAADPARTAEVKYNYATFLWGQFGTQTMAQYAWYFRYQDDDNAPKEARTYDLHTLAENETIARLANGVKRFTLPDEYNPIKVYQEVAALNNGYQQNALTQLARIFEDRRQFDRAAEYWRQAGDPDEAGDILNNWGVFEPIVTQPAGKGATVDYRFRNGNRVSLEAYAINIPKLLADVKAYIRNVPTDNEQWYKMNVSEIGYRLVQANETQYLQERVAAWQETLTPRDAHFDKRVTINTPLTRAGAYLLTAQMANGNISRIIVWVADTAIVKKPLENRGFYYVADAVSGAPVADATVDFFGYNFIWVDDKPGHGGHRDVKTKSFQMRTDAEGQIITTPEQQPNDLSWLITASKGGRLAYIGFTGAWYGRRYDEAYNQTKTFVITDRPVYRPDQPVKFKVWVNQAKYDQEGKSPYAGQTLTVAVNNPKGEKIFEKALTADEFGGISGEFTLPADATLGVYSLYLPNGPGGGGSFRVEEYKKPEYEVKVEAPKEPVMLGEKITATVKANYYFGAPVTEAKVKYKVLRSSYSASWYPTAYWDWFYGHGYWWYAYDYTWYPGWREWGCPRPVMEWNRGWWYYRQQAQPEVVAEYEGTIRPDGTVQVEIDTAIAKAVQGDTDHRYEITAEVTDASRRTIVGQGTVLVARKPFKVYAWVDRGHYRVGDTIQADFTAQTLDNVPVEGTGNLSLLRLSYARGGASAPTETEVQRWALNTGVDGRAHQQITANAAGQYRLRYRVTDKQGHTQEGGYVFAIRGDGVAGGSYRFNDIEVIPDKAEYHPGETVNLMINTNQPNSTVLLFVRPANGIYLPPRLLRLTGQSTTVPITVTKADMPNFFVEAVTVANGQEYHDVREIVVPPEQRVLNVEVTPDAARYKPGQEATVKVKLTDPNGVPFQGTTVVSMYDKALEYISGGSNVPAIKEFFWKWRRSHNPQVETNLQRGGGHLGKGGERYMRSLGAFGYSIADEFADNGGVGVKNDAVATATGASMLRYKAVPPMASAGVAMPGPAGPRGPAGEAGQIFPESAADESRLDVASQVLAGPPQALVEPTVRTNFADTALWVGTVNTDANGEATVPLTMPENLSTWKTKVWAMGNGTAVGEGSAEVVTAKNLIIRLQAPRFFTERDEVVLSAIVHNYLSAKKTAKVALELDGDSLIGLDQVAAQGPDGQWVTRGVEKPGPYEKTVDIAPNGEVRVDWLVRVKRAGTATVRMKALTDEESDAMQMAFPVYVHGMLKTDSYSGVIRPEGTTGTITVTVPAQRQPEKSRLEIRYSPTLAGAMVDALPYLMDYPYGTTGETLSRFLPTVLTQKVLLGMGLNLQEIQQKRTNLNAQEIGDDAARAKQWQRFERNPVFDQAEVERMVKAGIERLASMQCQDGGWGWFSGYGEYSYPHTTAVVVHGLQVAKANGVAVPDEMLQRGVAWLQEYQNRRVMELQAHPNWRAWAMDAFTYMVLTEAGVDNIAMRDFLYRDRLQLPVYAKSMFGIALHTVKDIEKRDMVIRNIDQFLVQDDENQTAYLKMPETNWSWWYWYESEYEAQAYYLKLLCVVDPHGVKASRLVKYLLNNRKHATYWNSTRDTAICVEAFADYMKASGEDQPNMTVEVRIDGKTVNTVKIDRTNLFTFDNKVVLTGDAVSTGAHTIELVKTGTGPLYYNAYLTNFTLEDQITRAGLEIKVNRKYFKLVPVNKVVKTSGSNGQVLDMKVEKYTRQELANLDTLKSGDLVEVELTIDSKNDYEYILFEDMKPAGFEPVEVRSGYNGNDMGAYVEFRDERVAFFVHTLARGTHSVSYRMRAETPGTFSALPTKASAMYAPELRGNSDELKLGVTD